MRKFFSDITKYFDYSFYTAKASLRADVSGSYLTWLWWILDPFLFMMVYSFVSIIVFGKNEPYFPVFVFLGLGAWNFISHSISANVKNVHTNKSVISRIYLPKYTLVISNILENLFKYCITLGLTFILSIGYNVPLTWRIVFLPVILLVLIVNTFGVCCVCLHFGVYVKDLNNVIRILLRLVFYLSGIFYSIPKRVPEPYCTWLLRVNPAAMFINELRNIFLYGSMPNWKLLGIWLMIGVIISVTGVRLIQNNEQNYVKVV